MQSGTARTKKWVLEFEPEEAREVEPLMGWTSSRDMKSQIRMGFTAKDEAVAYARKHGIAFQISEPKTRKRKAKSYSDNFRYGRTTAWTH